MNLKRTRFETEMMPRPDDIDLFRHVHSSKYLDYLIAARFEQMERCYGMSMQEFLQRGMGWVVKVSHLEYKRPIGLGEAFRVVTWVEDVRGSDVEVRFEMLKADSGKVACVGWCHFTLIGLETGRPVPISSDILEKYSI